MMFLFLFFIHWVVYVSLSQAFDFTLPLWPLIIGLLSGSYFLASRFVKKVTGKLPNMLYLMAASWLGIIFIVFALQLVYQIVHISTGLDSAIFSGVLLMTSLLLAAYALYNGRRVIVKEYTLPVANLTKPVNAVHLTDIHIGTVRQSDFLQHVVNMTNELSPDVVYITGDLFDGSEPIDESVLVPLNSLQAPAFFSNGNHEEYEGLQYVRDTLTNINVELLENRMVVHEGIQIIGVNDKESLGKDETLSNILEVINHDQNAPTVLMYHTPVEWDSAREKGVDIMLSGHTHNGQIYPFTLLVRIFFKYINGLHSIDDKFLHVSPGTGTWGPPMRLGSQNQITVLKLVPKE